MNHRKPAAIKTFTAFRPLVSAETHTENQRNAPDMPQYEGAIFSNGTTVLCWLTARHSVSVWGSFSDMLDVHGHPEYGTYFIWDDGRIENYAGDGVFTPRKPHEKEML